MNSNWSRARAMGYDAGLKSGKNDLVDATEAAYISGYVDGYAGRKEAGNPHQNIEATLADLYAVNQNEVSVDFIVKLRATIAALEGIKAGF